MENKQIVTVPKNTETFFEDITKSHESLNILLTTMHKGAVRTDRDVQCINIIETVRLAELLRKEGHNVTIATTRDTDVGIAYENLEVNNFDRVLIMNSTIDFPGGEENKPIEALFEFLKDYKGTLYYILVDLAIPFKQLYPLIEKREWCKYKSADEINLKNDFIIISQSNNFDEVRRIHENSDINIVDIKYVPINEWILHTNQYVENTGKVDLIMGTSNRGGRRKSKYLDYFFGRENITVEFFGLIKEKDFQGKEIENLKKPTFTEKLKDATKIVEKNATGFATVIVGDKNYNNNIVTLRLSESLLANSITFIDEEFDTNHNIFPECEFFYVNNGEELERKILALKDNPYYYTRAIKIQHQLVEKLRQKNMPRLLSEALMA